MIFCKFCGEGFDSKKGLHIHSTQMHEQIDKDIRLFLNRPEKEITSSESLPRNPRDLLDVEISNANRSTVIEFLKNRANMEAGRDEQGSYEEKISQISEEVGRLKKEKHKLNSKIQHEMKEGKLAERRVKELKKKQKELDSAVNNLEERISDLEQDRKKIVSDINKKKKVQKLLAERIAEVSKKIEKIT